jgi:hypothetical protein
LWKENAFLGKMIDSVEKEVTSSLENRICVDFGSGSGRFYFSLIFSLYFFDKKILNRDGIFLAMRGWNVILLDNCQNLIGCARDLARANRVSHLVHTLMLDLSKNIEENTKIIQDKIMEISNGKKVQADLIHVARYLHRPLFPTMNHV